MNTKRIAGLVLGVLVVSIAGIMGSVALAHGGQSAMSDEQREHMMGSYGGGYGMGPGMMGSYGGGYGMGPGMMGSYGGGNGMGPGMMGSYGGGNGMGPGMMQSYGGGYGMGPGMMGMDSMQGLNLTAEQRNRINGIQDDTRRQNWATMGKIMDERSKLRDLYQADPWDSKAIGAVYGKIFDLRKQMIETSITAHNRLEGVLTQEQRDQLAQWQSGMPMGGGPGGHMQGAMGGGMMSQ